MKKIIGLLLAVMLLVLFVSCAVAESQGTVMYVKTANGKALNVRSSMSTADDSNIIGALKYGSKVITYGNKDGWTMIDYNKTTGYIMTKYLVKEKPAAYDGGSGSSTSKKAGSFNTKEATNISQLNSLASTAKFVDPYTVTGRPSHSIPLGLPQNDDAAAPISVPAACVSYCAYEFDPVAEDLDGSWKKVFYNAGNRRKYVITYNDQGKISRALTIPDSLAFYRIDPEKKIIQKYSVSNAEELLGGIDDIFEQKSERGVVGSEIEATDGRWCYRREHVTTSTDKRGVTREIKTYEYFDLETGILIRQVGGNKNFLRGIRIGLFYPELFELPEGYTMKTIDLTKAMGALRRNNNR